MTDLIDSELQAFIEAGDWFHHEPKKEENMKLFRKKCICNKTTTCLMHASDEQIMQWCRLTAK